MPFLAQPGQDDSVQQSQQSLYTNATMQERLFPQSRTLSNASTRTQQCKNAFSTSPLHERNNAERFSTAHTVPLHERNNARTLSTLSPLHETQQCKNESLALLYTNATMQNGTSLFPVSSTENNSKNAFPQPHTVPLHEATCKNAFPHFSHSLPLTRTQQCKNAFPRERPLHERNNARTTFSNASTRTQQSLHSLTSLYTNATMQERKNAFRTLPTLYTNATKCKNAFTFSSQPHHALYTNATMQERFSTAHTAPLQERTQQCKERFSTLSHSPSYTKRQCKNAFHSLTQSLYTNATMQERFSTASHSPSTRTQQCKNAFPQSRTPQRLYTNATMQERISNSLAHSLYTNATMQERLSTFSRTLSNASTRTLQCKNAFPHFLALSPTPLHERNNARTLFRSLTESLYTNATMQERFSTASHSPSTRTQQCKNAFPHFLALSPTPLHERNNARTPFHSLTQSLYTNATMQERLSAFSRTLSNARP
ncbi:hypothetical protein C7M84_006804 [Penaeus vannamei]|uniref:Uncharacterized protein n=1 Tax=Penaeus vannamei TaxID=6689 RepID=A0A423TE14_PENVA|nr:hypothetical protein C7M84_006804 [Penaeus vannamei]